MSRLAVVVVAVLAILATVAVEPWSDTTHTDLPNREGQGRAILDGQLPYRDITFEYPILAAPFVTAPALAGPGIERYEIGFGVMTLVLTLATAALCSALASMTGGRALVAALAIAATPLLLGTLVWLQFDAAAIVALLLALLFVLRGRCSLAGVALGVAIAIKVFPVIAAPVLLAWVLARHGWGALLRATGVLVTTVAVAIGISVALSPAGFLTAVEYQLDRPAQIESAQASALLLIGALENRTPLVEDSRGSFAVIAPESGLVGALSAGILLAVLAWLMVGVVRGARDHEDPIGGDRALVLAAVTAVGAFALFGRVLSPQYLIWVFPLLALAVAWRYWALAAATATACILTLVEFPSRHIALIETQPFAVWVTGLRNLALALAVALGALGVAALSSRDRRLR